MLKKLRWLVPLAALVSVTAACGGDDDGAAETTADTTDAAAPADDLLRVGLLIHEPPNDLAWAQVAYESARSLEAEGVIQLTVLEEVSEDGPSTRRAVEGLVEDGVELIVAHSFNYGEPLKDIIGNFPDVAFAYAGGFGDNSDNLADYDQPFYEAAFLAGILAGGITETGIVGGTAGFNIPVCHSMIEAFRLGAELSYGEPVRKIEQYIGSWVDAARTREAVLAGIEQGADVWIACGVQDGTIEAAREANVTAIGYVMDQSPLAPENVMASIIWNFDEILRAMVADVEAGTFTPAQYYAIGFVDNGTTVQLNPEYGREIPAEVIELVEQYEADMRAGTFEVPYVPE